MTHPEEPTPSPSLPEMAIAPGIANPKRFSVPQIVLLLFLLGIVALGTLPGYLQGRWKWQHPPEVKTISQLRTLKKQGLEVPGWKTLQHKDLPIGGHRWSVQDIYPITPLKTSSSPDQLSPDSTVTLLLFPQTGPVEQPRVEWVDLNGFHAQVWQSWTTDSYQTRKISVTPDRPGAQPIDIQVRFFRGWNPKQTYAIAQWYAWDTGGSPAPVSWFWADRIAQGGRDRAPWVAVSLMIPIEPLGEIDAAWAIAQPLSETIQKTLMAGPLQDRP